MSIFGRLEPTCSEAAFQSALIHAAKLMGYLVHHDRPLDGARGWETAIQGDAGFPDCVFIHKQTGYTILAELKAKNGKTSPKQDEWLAAGRAGSTPTFLWHPRDWQEALQVLEYGARGATARAPTEQPNLPAKASDDPLYRKAEQTVQAWWDWYKRNHADAPPTAQPFVACVKVVKKLYVAGWTEREVKRCLADPDLPTVSVGAMQFARKKHQRATARPTNEMSMDEWRRRNAGRPLTEREPKPTTPTMEDDVIETTAVEQ